MKITKLDRKNDFYQLNKSELFMEINNKWKMRNITNYILIVTLCVIDLLKI